MIETAIATWTTAAIAGMVSLHACQARWGTASMWNCQVEIGAVLASRSPHAITRRPLGRQPDANRTIGRTTEVPQISNRKPSGQHAASLYPCVTLTRIVKRKPEREYRIFRQLVT